MRFLKNKIAHAQAFRPPNMRPLSHLKQDSDLEESISQPQTVPIKQKRRRISGANFTSEEVKSTKNIVINFARAISSFSTSKLAAPYLEPLAEQNNIDLKNFKEFVMGFKDTIGGISSFRSLLLVTTKDGQEEIIYKKIYKTLAEVFIKYFSVNWITHGRMGHKEIHMKYRFKMLRRVRNPEWFTYLKG